MGKRLDALQAYAGKQGIPGPKGHPEKFRRWVQEQYRQYTQDAIRVLGEIVNNENLKPEPRIAAAKELLDRGHGKALTVAQLEVLSTEGAQAVLDADSIKQADTNELLQLIQGLQKLTKQELIEGQARDITPDP